MDTPWIPKTTLPSDGRTVLTCIDDFGVPQCVSFARYDADKKRWYDLLVEEDEAEDPIFDYWMDIPPLPKTE